jgi:iron complex transport system substrate-binding protein
MLQILKKKAFCRGMSMNTLARVLDARVSLLILVLSIGGASGFTYADTTQRIVSVAGSVTEIVYALDLQSKLVGVDTTSQWPQVATALPQVGYQRALSAEGILSLAPSVVLATADAGPPEIMQQLIDAGIRIETFARDYSVGGLNERIRQIGKWFDREEEAQSLIVDVMADLTKTKERVRLRESPRVVFLLGTQSGSAMAAGRNTSAHAMIEYAGGSNPLESYEGYKPVNAEALIAAAPDVLVVVSHGGDIEQNIAESAAALPGVALTPAGVDNRIIVVDALRFLGFGPRSTKAILELSTQLHPLPNTR